MLQVSRLPHITRPSIKSIPIIAVTRRHCPIMCAVHPYLTIDDWDFLDFDCFPPVK